MDKKISIIVPIYNTEKYLDKCISSIINQTYRNLEIILVNDGSKDGSLEVCKKYEKIDKRIKVLNIKNMGVSNARNRGIDISTGEFIMFCDSDDWVEPRWCEVLINSFDENIMSICAIKYNYEYENKKIDNILDYNKDIIILDKKRFFLLYDYAFNSPCNKIFSTKTIKDNNIRFNQNISLGEDVLFNLEYIDLSNSNLKYINTCLYNYRFTEEISLTSKYYKNHFEQCTHVYDEIHNFMIKFGNDDKELEYYFYKIYFNQLSTILYMNFSSYSQLNFLERFRENKKIMKSNQYRDCINKIEIKDKKLYNYLFTLNTYVPIYIYTKLYKLLKGKK